MTDSNFQIIAVDNDSRELDKIRKAFDLLKTPCLPILSLIPQHILLEININKSNSKLFL